MSSQLTDRSFSIVGILNVTPDSYYDGGKNYGLEEAVAAAGRMLGDGADLVEVGGESTGPGSKDLPVEEELKRTIPVLRELRARYPELPLGIDTTKATVAREALEIGVVVVNDVSAGRRDPGLLPLVREAGVRVVLMYAKDPSPRTTVQLRHYDDVVSTVKGFLRERRDAAVAAGVGREHIILDPGLGHFVSADPRYSFQLIARLREFLDLGCPLLLSPSRKSFLRGSEDLPPSERLPGTVAASAIAVLHGASYIRTHDVKEVQRACEIAFQMRERLKT